MTEYDFHQLSPYEFEALLCDLFRAEFGGHWERFKRGRDGGIDLRGTTPSETIIVQCKHLRESPFRALRAQLKEEARRAAALRCDRYMVATSQPLDPRHKSEITRLLAPALRAERDVWGLEDLNSALSRHPTVERQHYKLWVPSAAVLDRFLHSDIVSDTEFTIESIRRDVSRYVQSESFGRALEMLETHGVVIISGAPGVGKTTLARMLLYQHVQQNFEPIVLSHDIRDGLKVFRRGSKQMFYFDDFLGSTFLGDRTAVFGSTEARSIRAFISLIVDSEASRLILTTREHILNQAISRSEQIRQSEVPDRRLVLAMSEYTRSERARILYNHIYFSDLPAAIRAEILRDEFYFEIIDHKSFNPRLVEWFSSNRRTKHIDAGAYRAFVRSLLQDPSDIWLGSYREQISDAARSLLLALFIRRDAPSVEQLSLAFGIIHEERAKRYRWRRKPEEYRAALRELSGSFVRVTHGNKVEFLDPSVRDLMNSVIRDSPEEAFDLFLGCSAFEQVESVWYFATGIKSNLLSTLLPYGVQIVQIALDRFVTSPLYKEMRSKPGELRSVEHTFATLVYIVDSLEVNAALEPMKAILTALEEKWMRGDVDILGAIDLLGTLEQRSWIPRDYLERCQRRCRDVLLLTVSEGCNSEALTECIDFFREREEETSVTMEALREGARSYLWHHYEDDLRDSRADGDYSELGDFLTRLDTELGVDVGYELSQLGAEEAAVEARAAARREWDFDWPKRSASVPTNEKAEIRELFASLGSADT